MKRLYIAIALLALSITLCCIQQRVVKNINTTSQQIITQALEAIDSNSYDKAKDACNELEKFWQDNYSAMSSMIDHRSFYEASLSIKKVHHLAQENDDALREALIELKGQIEAIWEDEKITPGNIF